MKRNSKRSNSIPFLAIVLIILLSFGGCQNVNNNDILPKKEEISVTLSLKLPTTSRGLKTYAMSDDEETNLKDIDVLVFTDDGSGMKFSYRAVGKIINQSAAGNGGGNADIEVKLWQTQLESRLVIIANARAQLNAYPFVAGELLSVLQRNLVYELEAGERWLANLNGATEDYIPLPMWAEFTVEEGINSGTIILPGAITLLRSVARVDVVVSEDTEDRFLLDAVYVFNTNRNGLIIPTLTGGPVIKPSLPSDLKINDDLSSPLEYRTNGEDSEGEIYLFETLAADPLNLVNATGLVIEGRFPNETKPGPYYYRIDFREAGGDFVPLLRNHRYLINIVSAEFDGAIEDDDRYGNAREAFEAGLPLEPHLDLEAPLFGSSAVSTRSKGTYLASPSFKHKNLSVKSPSGLQYTIITINEQE